MLSSELLLPLVAEKLRSVLNALSSLRSSVYHSSYWLYDQPSQTLGCSQQKPRKAILFCALHRLSDQACEPVLKTKSNAFTAVKKSSNDVVAPVIFDVFPLLRKGLVVVHQESDAVAD